MAVLLLYTLQLAVNAVKAFLSPPPAPQPLARLCFSLYARRCTAFLAGFPNSGRTRSGSGRGGTRESPRTEHPIQGSAAPICKGFLPPLLIPKEAWRAEIVGVVAHPTPIRG